MKSIIIALCVALAYAGQPLPESLRDIFNEKIIGGGPAQRGQFPSIISLQRRGGMYWYHACGGTLISVNRVLTAAHCVDGLASHFRIVAGIHTLSGTTPEQRSIAVTTIITHPNYSSSTLANDVAILRLESNVIFDGHYVHEADLPAANAGIPTGQAIVAGWGSITEDGSVSDSLQFVQLPVLTDAQCKADYGSLILPGMMCAGLDNGGKDACYGDAGGPLVQSNTFVGIVSWGFGCARPNQPGVYSAVSYFRNWIDRNSG